MADATIDTTVTDDGDRVVVELPPGSSHAALALRIQAESDEHVRHILMGLADRFALVVQEFNQAMQEHGAGNGSVMIVAGAEAIAAFDIAAMQTAAAIGLERPGNHTAVPERDTLADFMRTRFVRSIGADPNAVLPWARLQDSERRAWRSYADSAIAYMTGSA